jgi:hypothetical protein
MLGQRVDAQFGVQLTGLDKAGSALSSLCYSALGAERALESDIFSEIEV